MRINLTNKTPWQAADLMRVIRGAMVTATAFDRTVSCSVPSSMRIEMSPSVQRPTILKGPEGRAKPDHVVITVPPDMTPIQFAQTMFIVCLDTRWVRSTALSVRDQVRALRALQWAEPLRFQKKPHKERTAGTLRLFEIRRDDELETIGFDGTVAVADTYAK